MKSTSSMLATARLILSALFIGVPALSPLMAEVVRLKPAPSPADNPLKGLVPYSDYAEENRAHFPHSLEFDYLSLAELMRGPSSFDWQPMDTLRDRVHLEELWAEAKAPWKVW